MLQMRNKIQLSNRQIFPTLHFKIYIYNNTEILKISQNFLACEIFWPIILLQIIGRNSKAAIGKDTVEENLI